MKKICSKCFMSAIAYQAPEVWIPFLRAYPQIETGDEQECDFHSNTNRGARDSDILMWMFDSLDNNREPV